MLSKVLVFGQMMTDLSHWSLVWVFRAGCCLFCVLISFKVYFVRDGRWSECIKYFNRY